jgi:hypothetical protein
MCSIFSVALNESFQFHTTACDELKPVIVSEVKQSAWASGFHELFKVRQIHVQSSVHFIPSAVISITGSQHLPANSLHGSYSSLSHSSLSATSHQQKVDAFHVSEKNALSSSSCKKAVYADNATNQRSEGHPSCALSLHDLDYLIRQHPYVLCNQQLPVRGLLANGFTQQRHLSCQFLQVAQLSARTSYLKRKLQLRTSFPSKWTCKCCVCCNYNV